MHKRELEVIVQNFEDVTAVLVLMQDALIVMNKRITELENAK